VKRVVLLFAGLLLAISASAVEKRYVSDKLYIQLRSGPSQEYRILKVIQSGEHLIVLEENETEGYTKVKTDKGVEGWVLTRFLENEPIAKEKLILANRELEQLRAEKSTTQSQSSELQAELETVKSERSTLARDNAKLEKELERIMSISDNALALDEKTKKLTLRNQELEIQVETMTNENAQLRDDSRQTFLLYGGGLVFIGIFAGLVLPGLRGKRNNSGWS
jgi:SH3 domain protein